ncbi:MAG: hypothetical protein JW959_10800 [Pirellulales bacterium]|nr:hypothetical protein [Pirellulales bacterium]
MNQATDEFGPPSDRELLDDLESAAKQLCDTGITEAQLRIHLERIIGYRLPLKPMGALRERVEQIAAGRYISIPLPWPETTRLALPALPGCVAVLGGGVGSSKSFMVVQCMLYWLANGVDVATLALEGDITFYLHRALAQLAEVSAVTDPQWVKNNANRMRELLDLHAPVLERLARHWFVAGPLNIDSQEQCVSWVEQQAKIGRRVVAVDPITMLNRLGKPWDSDMRFVKGLKRTAETYGATILLVSHPSKGVSDPTRETLAAGAAYERFCDTMFVLQAHDMKTSLVRTACGTVEIEHNRTLRVEKSRHGSGTGCRLAMRFSPETLLMAEQGIIIKTRKGQDRDK